MSNFSSSVGIIANPAAGRDIRRLVAQASVFPISEKRNMITRIFSALGMLDVETVYMMPDGSGIADRVRHALTTPPPTGQRWPRVVFLDMAIENTAVDTVLAVQKMVALGVGGIIVLGGDGTHRLVASEANNTPITALSTGTNNVFPYMREATIAGLAAGIVALGHIDIDRACVRNKVLRVDINGVQSDLALVDLCTSTELWVGSRALWKAEGLDQLFLSFAEPDAIGLSAIGGLIQPLTRSDTNGLWLNLGDPESSAYTLNVPLAPGLMVPIGIKEVHELVPGTAIQVRTDRGVIALDGEREIEFSPNDKIAIRLEWDGPLTINIPAVMSHAAEFKILCN